MLEIKKKDQPTGTKIYEMLYGKKINAIIGNVLIDLSINVHSGRIPRVSNAIGTSQPSPHQNRRSQPALQ